MKGEGEAVLDKHGVNIEANDIVVLRGNDAFRFARAVVVGYTAPDKRTPLIATLVFDAHGAAPNSWALISDSASVERVSGKHREVKMDALVRQVPELFQQALPERIADVARQLGAELNPRVPQLA